MSFFRQNEYRALRRGASANRRLQAAGRASVALLALSVGSYAAAQDSAAAVAVDPAAGTTSVQRAAGKGSPWRNLDSYSAPAAPAASVTVQRDDPAVTVERGSPAVTVERRNPAVTVERGRSAPALKVAPRHDEPRRNRYAETYVAPGYYEPRRNAYADTYVAPPYHARRGGPQFTCNSYEYSFSRCYIPDGGGGHVRLVAQHSGAACAEGRDWGVGRGEVWVDNGCRATFENGW